MGCDQYPTLPDPDPHAEAVTALLEEVERACGVMWSREHRSRLRATARRVAETMPVKTP